MAFDLIHPDLLAVNARLIDPAQSVALPIVKDRTPGELRVFHCLVPPHDVSRHELSNNFTVELGNGIITVLSVMTSLVHHESGTYTILGLHQHDRTSDMLKLIPESERTGFKAGVTGAKTDRLYVGAKFNAISRSGMVYVSNEFNSIIRRIHKGVLLQAEERMATRRAQAEPGGSEY